MGSDVTPYALRCRGEDMQQARVCAMHTVHACGWHITHSHLLHLFAVLAGPGQADEPPGRPLTRLLLAGAAAAAAATAVGTVAGIGFGGAAAAVLRQVLHAGPGADRGGVHAVPLQLAGEQMTQLPICTEHHCK